MTADNQIFSLLSLFSRQAFLIEQNFAHQVLANFILNSQFQHSEQYWSDLRETQRQIEILSDGRLVGIMQNEEEMNSGDGTETIGIPGGSIAKVTFDGMMTSQDPACGIGMRSLDKQLRSLYQAKNIDGILLKMETGGGQSQAGDILFNAVQDKNKPIAVHTSFLASAGIKGTLPADLIIAESQSTMVGSIGTMFSISKTALDQARQDVLDIYPPSSPRKNEEFRSMLSDNFDPLIQKLERIDELFMRQVQKFRNLKGDKETINETLSGATFDALNAKRRGLVDGIGTENHALKRLRHHISLI